MKKPHTCSVLVGVGEKATFDVTYQPKVVGRTQASIQLSVEDNQYEDSLVQVKLTLAMIGCSSFTLQITMHFHMSISTYFFNYICVLKCLYLCTTVFISVY